MIPPKKHGKLRCAQRDQPIEYFLGCRPAIDVIAEKDVDCMFDRPIGDVGLDASEEAVEKVEPAVHVADRIKAKAFGHPRAAKLHRPRVYGPCHVDALGFWPWGEGCASSQSLGAFDRVRATRARWNERNVTSRTCLVMTSSSRVTVHGILASSCHHAPLRL